jgi:CRP-like cAMP-binding protein
LPSAPQNQLLASLPADSLARLACMLEPVQLQLRDILHRAGDLIARVYFPLSGWLSMLAPLEGGGAAEVGLIGNEGMVGFGVALGVTHDNLEPMVQGQGTALAMRVEDFRAALESDPALRALVLRYAFAHLIQVSRTAACNVHHPVEQRLARWLLMSHDRAAGDSFTMTHAFLGMMLSVQGPEIDVALGALHKTGLIRYEGDTVTVADRPALEHASCECYGLVRRAFDPLVSGGPEGQGSCRA